MPTIFLNRELRKFVVFLRSLLMTISFLILHPMAHAADAPKTVITKGTSGWNHHGRIKICINLGDKRCPTLTIPRGIRDKEIHGIVRTHIVQDAANEFLILGNKHSYLCVDGYGTKLRCQRLTVPSDPMVPPDPATRKTYIQNAITLLRATRPTGARSLAKQARLGLAAPSLIDEGGGGYCDEDTGECEGGGGGGGGEGGWGGGGGSEGGGGYDDQQPPGPGSTYEPIPDPGPSGDIEADAIVSSWLSVANSNLALTFANTGVNSYGRLPYNAEECASWMSSCRDNCGDRGNAGYAMCGIVTGVIASAPPRAAWVAAIIFGGACVYGVYNAVDTCKQSCSHACFW